MATMKTNYYAILDVPKNANAELIREAYKKMAIKWHPDKNIDNKDEAEARFKKIAEAYQVLSDDNRRLKYDRSQNSDGDYSGYTFDGFFMTPDRLFSNFHHDFPRNEQYNRQRMNFGSGKGGRQANTDRNEYRCFNDAPRDAPAAALSTKPTTIAKPKHQLIRRFGEGRGRTTY